MSAARRSHNQLTSGNGVMVSIHHGPDNCVRRGPFAGKNAEVLGAGVGLPIRGVEHRAESAFDCCAAAQRFAIYAEVITDVDTRDVFVEILRDEAFHMNYTYAQLKRVAPRRHGRRLFLARLGRLWKGYLRIASALASILGGIMLTAQYFIILPLFALRAKRDAGREQLGWLSCRAPRSLHSQY